MQKDKPQVRIDIELHRKLKIKAASEGTTIGQLIEHAIKETFRFDKDDSEKEKPKDTDT